MRWTGVVLALAVLTGGCAREETPPSVPVVPEASGRVGGKESEAAPTAKPTPVVVEAPKEAPTAEAVGDFATAKAVFEAGKVDEALPQLREAVVREPKNAEAYYYLGRAYQAKRMTAEAARAYQSAVRLDKDYMWPHYDLGRLLMDQKQYDGAVASFRRAIALKDDYAWSHAFLGQCLAAQGDTTGALASYESAARCEPRNVFILQNLASACEAGGDKTRAIATYEKIAVHGKAAEVKAAKDAIARLKGEPAKPPVEDTPVAPAPVTPPPQ